MTTDEQYAPTHPVTESLADDIQGFGLEDRPASDPPVRHGFKCFVDLPSGGKVLFTDDQYLRFTKLIDRVANYREIGQQRGKERIGNALQNIIGAWLFHRIGNSDELRKRLDLMLAALIAPVSADVFFPVAGLELQDVELEIGGVKFVGADERFKASFISKLASQFRLNGQFVNDIQRDFTRSFPGVVCVGITKIAADCEVSLQSGLEEVEDKLDFVAAMIPACRGVSERIWFTIGPAYDRVFVFAVGKTEFKQREYSSRPLGWCLIGEPQKVRLQQYGFQQLADIIGRPNRSNTEMRVCRMAKWLGRSLRMKGLQEQFLLATNAIEAAFTKKDASAPVAQNLGEGVALVTETDAGKRQGVAREFARLYGLRSKLVHGQSFELGEDNVRKAQLLAFRTMTTLLVNMPALAQVDLDSWTQEQKFQAPSCLKALPADA